MAFERRNKPLVLATAAIAVFSLDCKRPRAEPALDKVLSSVQVSNQTSCTALSIAFNLRVKILSHFPQATGQELRIILQPIDGAQAAAEILAKRESLRPPMSKFATIRAIDFDARNPAAPVLVLQFEKDTNFQVAQGSDFQSVVVKLLGKNRTSPCLANFDSQEVGGAWSASVSPQSSEPGTVKSRRTSKTANGPATADQKRSAAAWMDEGRAALRKNDVSGAIAKFSKVLSLPETDVSAEAQEMLGLARQRNKQLAEARAEYEDYLTRYPTGEGADRVRQRLAGVLTASGQTNPVLKSAKNAPGGRRDDGSQTWTVSGSASQFYIRDDSFRALHDPSLPQTANEDLDSHQTHQNELLTSIDTIATWSGNGLKSKFRFSGTEEHKFDGDIGDIVGVAALYLDTAVRDWGVQGRIGRQTRNTGGVLGRFDGAVLSLDAMQPFRLNMVVGSPVLRRRDSPFEDDKLFYGASLDMGPWNGLDLSIFAIEQRDRSILDRRAVGAEARYVDADKSAFGLIDYDVHYADLNAAVLTGSMTLADKSVLHAAFDYRKSPYLSTWNALQGQSYPTLYAMLKNKTLAEIEQLAADRTASFTSISGGFSRPLSEMFQVSADVTATDFSGTPASGGLLATEGTGWETFYATQIIGNGVLEKDDLLIVGLRFADLQNSNYYVMDVSYRYPLMESLKVSPHVMIGYRTGDSSDLVEYSVLPSVLFDYYLSRDLSLEFEAGARWTNSKENNVEETTTDLFFTIGYRYDFYADGSVPSSQVAPYGLGHNPTQGIGASGN